MKEYETKVAWAKKLAEQEKLTEVEAQKYILQAKLEYAQKAAGQVNQIAEQASNFASALKEAETAKLEAEYQAQLTAAGDNAEKREQIEAEYEEKKLDLQKKYADVDMAINIAKTVANGAVAAVKAVADLLCRPPVGSLVGALKRIVFRPLIVATSARDGHIGACRCWGRRRKGTPAAASDCNRARTPVGRVGLPGANGAQSFSSQS